MKLKCIKNTYANSGGGGAGDIGGGNYVTVTYDAGKINGLTVGKIYTGFRVKSQTGYYPKHLFCVYNDQGNWSEYDLSLFAPLSHKLNSPREFTLYVDAKGELHNVNTGGGMTPPLTPIKLREVK